MTVPEFVSLVREYMALVDHAPTSTAHAFLSSCSRILPRLYAAGIELPEVEPTTEEVGPQVASPMRAIAALLGRYATYFEVFDPCVDEPTVVGSLGDDLADIYLDVANPLVVFDSARIADAVWQWRFNMQGHCGDHLVDAMRAIHRLVNDHMPPEYVASIDRAG